MNYTDSKKKGKLAIAFTACGDIAAPDLVFIQLNQLIVNQKSNEQYQRTILKKISIVFLNQSYIGWKLGDYENKCVWHARLLCVRKRSTQKSALHELL